MLSGPRRIVLEAAVPKRLDRVFARGLVKPSATADGKAIERAVRCLERRVNDPTKGLPEPVFRLVSSLVPMVNVDLLIRNSRGETLLTWREDGFYPSGWHIPGGIIRYKESLAARIRAVALKELGVRVRFDPRPLAVTEAMTPSQHIRAHFVSFLYRCSLTSALPKHRKFVKGAPKADDWAWHRGCPRDLMDCQKKIYGRFLRAIPAR